MVGDEDPNHNPSKGTTMEMAVANVSFTTNMVKKLSSAAGEVVPLTALDLVAPNTPIPMILAFRAPLPDNAVMIDSLLETLFHYPHLAGRLAPGEDGWPSIHLDNTGVRVVETQVPTTLDENLPFDPASKLYFNMTPLMAGEELLRVQLNRFACGGVILGITIHHWVADAMSYAAFLTSWSRAARGLELEVLPYHERHLAVTAAGGLGFEVAQERRKRPFADCSPIAPAPLPPPATNICVHYTRDFLASLKSRINSTVGGAPNDQCSTFQCLIAHVWKKITRVRGVDAGTTTSFQFSVNGRRRMKPVVPDEYFGNYILAVTATMKAGELLEKGYPEVGREIRELIRGIDDAYFKSFVEYAASVKAEEVMSEMVGPTHSLGPNVFNTSWVGVGFDHLDFGSGGPCAFLVPGIPIEGFSVFLPAYEEGGGINVLLALKDAESAERFRSISHTFE